MARRRDRRLQPGSCQNCLEFAGADHGIYFRHILADFVAIALHQAAGHDQLARLAGDFVLRHLKDGVNRLLLGFIDERACVYDQNVCRLRTVGHLGPGTVKQTHHDFAVNQVLRAAQAHEANAWPLLEHCRNYPRDIRQAYAGQSLC